MGDFLLTGGADANIVIWNSNLNERVTEELFGITAVKIETDVFVTDKPDVKKLPNNDKDKESKKKLPPKGATKEGPKGKDVFVNGKDGLDSHSCKPPIRPQTQDETQRNVFGGQS